MFIINSDHTNWCISIKDFSKIKKGAIENMHREIKQLMEIENYQYRKRRIQRNHISYAFLVWAFLKRTVSKIEKIVYRIKLGLLDDYMQQ